MKMYIVKYVCYIKNNLNEYLGQNIIVDLQIRKLIEKIVVILMNKVLEMKV